MNLSKRDIRLDALRGMFLLIMAAVHVPTPVSHWLQEPFGFTSAAEGFIFLSASLAGLVYGRVGRDKGWSEMNQRIWGRARQVYLTHLAVLLPMVLAAWLLAAWVTPLANHFHAFLQAPWESLGAMPLLLHQPPLFDILPLYVLFLLATPLVLWIARRAGWRTILGISAGAWSLAQIGADAGWERLLRNAAPVCPGHFDLLAWQLLWVSGLALGTMAAEGRQLSPGRPAGIFAGVIVCVGFLARHGILPVPQDGYLWMDKWTLGPLRLLNFSAWVVLLLSWNPRFKHEWLERPALLGRHSLHVFAWHLPLVVAAGALVQLCPMPGWMQVMVGLSVMVALFPLALWSQARIRQRREFGPARTLALPGRDAVLGVPKLRI
ncbi:MAG: OpgC domain-containing protein [Verrucomicrobiota bacterium]